MICRAKSFHVPILANGNDKSIKDWRHPSSDSAGKMMRTNASDSLSDDYANFWNLSGFVLVILGCSGTTKTDRGAATDRPATRASHRLATRGHQSERCNCSLSSSTPLGSDSTKWLLTSIRKENRSAGLFGGVIGLDYVALSSGTSVRNPSQSQIPRRC
jgi:hypothetical protein